MSEQDISKTKATFEKFLSEGRIYRAVSILRSLSEKKMMWEITDAINKIEDSYRYMLRYAVDAVDDPQRKAIYAGIVDDLSMLFDRLLREMEGRHSSAVYFQTARSGRVMPIADAVSTLRSTLRNSDSFTAALEENVTPASQLEVEAKEISLFESTWTRFPYSRDDADALLSILTDISVPEHSKGLAISAITLGELQFHDPRRITLLADIYSDESIDDRLRLIALTGLLLSLYIHRKRHLSPTLTARLAALADMPTWRSDIRTVFLELIRTRDTERITSKLRDEIVPEMMKMKPTIDKKLGDDFGKSLDLADVEENPEWQEFLESSGIADKMKELSEIQEEGGDVMMGTFSNLKAFPFFFNVANWFMPFHTSHSTVAALGINADVVSELIAASSFMCDSDKYSFILAISSMPEQQREMMLSQLQTQNINAAELRNSTLDLAIDRRRNIINKYVQNLYRFFRLFRRKEDFVDPLANEINLTEVKPLQSYFLDDDTLQLVGEFYFKHKYYEEALRVFTLSESRSFPDARLYQKMGYCLQMTGNISRAVEYYEQADLLNGNSLWTLRRLARCHQQLGAYDKALSYYSRIDQLQPSKAATAFNIGQCHLAMQHYADAAKAFYKASFLDETDDKAKRPLAWSLLMQKDFEGAAKIYDTLIANAPQPSDHLNRGHIAMASRDYHGAIAHYIRFVQASPDGITDYFRELDADTSSLITIGVDSSMLPLVADAVCYALKS